MCPEHELVAQDLASVFEDSGQGREAVTFAFLVRKLFIASGEMGTFVNTYCCFRSPLIAEFSGLSHLHLHQDV